MGKTIKEIIDTMNEEQQAALYSMIGVALEDDEMEHSDIDPNAIIQDGMQHGSLRDAVLEHADQYGIEGIETLFPDARLAKEPTFLNNPVEWVNDVLGAVSKLPFSRVKTMFVDLTEESLRAKGYFKGNLKKEDVFSLLKRTTEPTTIYKKQKIDRDDVIDITDFEVISWIKKEMRMKLDEELARCILFGDGRLQEDEFKIDDDCIRPVLTDADLYTIKVAIDTSKEGYNKYDEFVSAMIRNRKLYKGSGNPVLYMSEDTLSELLLMKDADGRRLYKSVEDIAKEMRVSKIVSITEMSELVRDAKDEKTHNVLGIMVNLSDYSVGINKGGQVAMFDDFDIDFNQMKYLIETRCSGALTKPYSAMVIEEVVDTQESLPADLFEKEDEYLDE